jgi:hypothetical protein
MYHTCSFYIGRDSKGKALEVVVVHEFCGCILEGLFKNDLLPLLIAGIIFIIFFSLSFCQLLHTEMLI